MRSQRNDNRYVPIQKFPTKVMDLSDPCSHVVIVNHSLLFSDIVSENAVIGEYEDLILDEAHNIEKIAAQYLGRELKIWRIKNLSDQLRSPGFNSTGTLPALRHWMSVAKVKDNVFATFDAGIGSFQREYPHAFLPFVGPPIEKPVGPN